MAANDRTLKILMQIRADIAELEKLHGGLDKTKAKLKETSVAGQALFAGFAAGVGIGAFQAVTNALSQIPRVFANAVSEGVNFNATLESSKLGIAAIIKQFDTTGRFKNFDDALNASGNAIELLKEKALQSPATFEQLVQAFQGVSGAASAANIPIKQQVDLVVLMSQALAGLGIRSDQILQESRALLTGNITEDAMAARILGITKAQVDAAKSQGQLFEFLTGKLNAFAEAGVRGQQSYTTQVANLGDALTQLKGIATAELFTVITDGLKEVNALLSDPKTSEGARGIGAHFSDFFKAFKESIEGTKDDLAVLEKIITLGGALKVFAVPAPSLESGLFDAAAAQQFIDVAQRARGLLIDQIAHATTLEQKAQAIIALEVQRVTLAERVGDKNKTIAEAAETQLGLLAELNSMFKGMAGSAQDVHASMRATADEIERAIKVTAALRDVQSQITLVRAQVTGDTELENATKLEQLRSKTIEHLVDSGVEQTKAVRQADELVNVTREQLQLEQSKKLERQSGTAADRESRDLLREQRDLLRDTQAHRQTVESDPFLTISARQAQLIPILEQERDQLRATGQEWAALKVQMELATMTFSGGVQTGLTSWVNSFGTAATQIANTLTGVLNTAISGTANAITGLIVGTKNLGQAALQTFTSILEQVIQLGLQMIVTKALGSALNRQNVTEQTAAGAQIAAAHAPAAAATSISSWGSAAVIGGIAAAAAIALIIGLLASGGFERGGYTGDIGAKQVAGVVHGREYVFDAPATSRLGVGFLERLRRGEITLPVRGYEGGGFVSPFSSASGSAASSGARPVQIVQAFFDDRLDAKTWLDSQEGEKHFVDLANRNSHRLS